MKTRPTTWILALAWLLIVIVMICCGGCANSDYEPPAPPHTVNADDSVTLEDGTVIEYKFNVGDKARHKCGKDVVITDRTVSYVVGRGRYVKQNEGYKKEDITYQVLVFTEEDGFTTEWVYEYELEDPESE